MISRPVCADKLLSLVHDLDNQCVHADHLLEDWPSDDVWWWSLWFGWQGHRWCDVIDYNNCDVDDLDNQCNGEESIVEYCCHLNSKLIFLLTLWWLSKASWGFWWSLQCQWQYRFWCQMTIVIMGMAIDLLHNSQQKVIDKLLVLHLLSIKNNCLHVLSITNIYLHLLSITNYFLSGKKHKISYFMQYMYTCLSITNIKTFPVYLVHVDYEILFLSAIA